MGNTNNFSFNNSCLSQIKSNLGLIIYIYTSMNICVYLYTYI